jgi:glucosamine 6-phosphate synthetase-like amidotransferase/phosphosugar isomerase protein
MNEQLAKDDKEKLEKLEAELHYIELEINKAIEEIETIAKEIKGTYDVRILQEEWMSLLKPASRIRYLGLQARLRFLMKGADKIKEEKRHFVSEAQRREINGTKLKTR